ncbi:MAG: VOC family protein [Rhodospirillales bacterium]|nr:VOC family protein [Rhodospirillales bacterium]MDH3914163.1 VOC family protein [Rhodospirillales bacterium]MDH3916979.1 VOC family protein [Rhodospirillales bacterium]MDH3968932.1 VOC family protein [Rhodospirillales bacterium]
MIGIRKIDHVGIRVRDKHRSIAFYEDLGFALIVDTGFEKGHPIIMRHPSGIVLNLLGPGTEDKDENVLMDVERKYAGYTHMALRIDSLAETEAFLAEKGIEITGRFTFKDMNAIFIRDPDRNVIELDEYPGEDPVSRLTAPDDDCEAYDAHP